MEPHVKLDPAQRKKLIKQREVAKGMLTRMQEFIDSGNPDVNQTQVRFNKLPSIYAKYEASQEELESYDEADHTDDRADFESQYFAVEARFHEIVHANLNHASSISSEHGSSTACSTQSSNTHIRLPVIELPTFAGDHCQWLHFRDTFETLIVNNTSLSNVQRLHYLVSVLKGEAKELIINLPITHDNFVVAWNLITHRYNSIKLIAMKHVNHLIQLPQTKKGDATSLRHLINHVTSHMNAIEALTLNTSMHTLILNHLLLSVLDSETHKAWELQTSTQEDVPSTTQIIAFLEQRCKALELLQPNQATGTVAASNKCTSSSSGNKVSQTLRCHLTTQSQCPLCKGSHRLFHCTKFIKWSPQQRMDFARKSTVCYNCLQQFSKDHACSNQTCKGCNKRHHTLLHGARYSQRADDRSPTTSRTADNRGTFTAEVNTYCSFKGKPTNHVLLATAVVEVQTKSNQYVPCRVLLDSASQLNFITEQCVKRLGLTKQQTNALIQGINKVNTSTHHSVNVQIRSKYTDWQSTVSCAVLPLITDNTPTTRLNISSWNLPQDIQLADNQFNEPGHIDILLGAELFYEILLPERKTRRGHPIIQETVLGWIICGKTPTTSISRVKQQSFLVQDTTSLELDLNRFWEVEVVESLSMTSEQQACEQHFIKHTTQQPDGRFIVKLPLKGEPNELGTSRRMAETRLLAIERRLDKNLDLKFQYHKFMRDYEAAGHMEPAHSQVGENTTCYYLPHHPVFKETSTTTKTRVVFDGGAKTSTGMSLNDILQVGPTVQQDLYSLVLRFRTHQVCFTADIAQMYRQVNVHPQDRDLQRILWRYSSDDPIQEYRLTTVTYGTASAPFLATRCLRKLADDNLVNHPRAAQVLRDDFYVDDLLSGTSTVEEAIEIQRELSTLLETAGFPLRKWASNHSRFLANIPKELQETKQTLSLDNEDGVTTLGLQWNPKTDQLQVRNNSSPSHSTHTASTKRKVLAITASIFDPLGLLNPAVIVHKVFLQKLWQDKLDWDTQLPTPLQDHWNRLMHTIPQLFHIKFPRKVVCANASNIQIHGFCDSSERAYGACLYIRSTNNKNQTVCELLCSTSRVAPLKQLTIPRLELCAAVLLAKLFRRATRALNLTVHDAYLWTDSLIVLTWIQGASTRWKTFVGNRIAFIQEATADATWRHVPSSSNPADLISRGTDPTTLSTATLWWHGPDWLSQNLFSWPSMDFKPATEDLEIKKTFVSVTTPREDITERFSKFIKLIRVIAYCRRFIHNCRQLQVNRETTTLTTRDLDQAWTCCVKLVQQTSYAQEVQDLTHQHEVSSKSSLRALYPFIDQEGILRVGGRLQQSTLPYQAIHQVILPPSHHVTKLIVSSEHLRLHHAGPQLLIASLREKYWIPRIRNTVKTVIHHCLTCYRYKVQASQQLMSEQPSLRVRPARPFLTTGVDYAGPISIRLGPPRSKQVSKGYIAIFVCFVVKAVHIELVTSLTTDAFLAALRRFIARRGKPRTIYSDNGTSFQGAAHQLHEVYAMLHSSSQMATVQDYLTSEGCNWRFIPPHGPHHGGLWEAAVKSMKHHLRRTLGSQIATYEELCTLLTEIEACLNSRPLCALSSDPHFSTYLSPGHFLIGDPLVQLPAVDLTNVKSNRLSRWQSYQQQLQLFWKRWSTDYINDLHQRQRWQKATPNLQTGEVVLLKEDNATPLQWPTAVIVDVHPGSDGKVRVVTVKTSRGTFKRPITKICPLPHVNDEL